MQKIDSSGKRSLYQINFLSSHALLKGCPLKAQYNEN